MRIEMWRDDRGRRWAIAVAETRRERRRGLLGLEALGSRQGLALRRCRSVHTIGMRFPIDVVALDRWSVVRSVRTVAPGRFVAPRPGVRHVLELAARSGVRPGDRFAPQTPISTTSPERSSTRARGSRSGIDARTSSAARRR